MKRYIALLLCVLCVVALPLVSFAASPLTAENAPYIYFSDEDFYALTLPSYYGLWAVVIILSCLLIVMIYISCGKARQIKRLKAELRKLENQLTDKSSRLAVYEVMHRHDTKNIADYIYDEDFMSEFIEPEPSPTQAPEPTPEPIVKNKQKRKTKKLSDRLADWFFALNFWGRLVLSLVLSVMPFVMLGLPWWADILIVLAIQILPFIGTAVHLGVYIWALVKVIQDGIFDVWTVLFYISFAVFAFAVISPFVIYFFERRVGTPKQRTKVNWGLVIPCVMLAGLVCLFAFSSSSRSMREASGFTWSAPAVMPNPTATPRPTPKPTATPKPTPSKPTTTIVPLFPYDFPLNGTVTYFTFEEDCVAPLEIIASSDYNYTIITVVRVGGVLPLIKAYAHEGETIEFNVPLGEFEIYTAEGDMYYGPEQLFSKEGVYSKLEKPLEFYEEGDYYYGHTLTLHSVFNGNIDSDSIDIEDFPI